MAGGKDDIFKKDEITRDWVFDKRVVDVFDDMVSRSVPFYRETHQMAVDLAKRFVQPETEIVDLGCSTATLLINAQRVVDTPKISFIGVDNSKSMLSEAKRKTKEAGYDKSTVFVEADIEKELPFSNASVVFMNYTLQFIRPLHRERLVSAINERLCPGGCLVILEKVLSEHSVFNRMYIDIYHEFKRNAGYNDEEIARKRESLENIMVPFRVGENIELMTRAGFGTVDMFFKWYNWVGYIAVKG
ncbi:MAG: carboxy-S-adenosyl-L-methionine synthase CmoA [Legionellales bacterium]|nr:carboxy-S-adenosyl-L-methionine synthase CmoA [Legionellales bacterium]